MHSHFTNLLLDIKELSISDVQKVDADFRIHVQPTDHLQSCPQCYGKDVIRKGCAYQRKVRHVPAFGSRVFLLLPAIRLMCRRCDVSSSGNMGASHLGKDIQRNLKIPFRSM
ncbi:transposase family protein [Planococcus kocurii]|uniref:transposase family protein n=1 Tax=Planococcus kocurii TaxID=1374 RepID=UPI003CFFFAD9